MQYQTELTIAKEALRKAAQLTSAVQKKLLEKDVLEKEDRSPVTVADFGSQAIVNFVLANNFPNDFMIAEEGSEELRKPENEKLFQHLQTEVQKIVPLSGEAILQSIDHGRSADPKFLSRFWTLDPIDGTKGFLRGDHYAIALALIENSEVKAAALACPNMTAPNGEKGLLCLASENQKTVFTSLFNDSPDVEAKEPLIKKFADAIICESVESGHTSHSRAEKIREALTVEAEPFRIDSQCKYAAVALGMADIYLRLPKSLEYKEKIWDHAAGFLIVEKAGGTVTDTLGRKVDFSTPPLLENDLGIVASRSLDHAKLITAVKASE